MQLGRVNSFLYGILLTVSIIFMIGYIIWLIAELCQDSDIKVKDKAADLKEKATKKWYEFRNYVKGVCDR